jgi:hypothetical protein
MVYAVTNPPRQVRNVGLYVGNSGSTTRGVGGQYWVYNSTDAKATVAAANYITNAVALGMLVGDVVEVQDTTTPMVSLHRVTGVASTGSTLSAGLNIT